MRSCQCQSFLVQFKKKSLSHIQVASFRISFLYLTSRWSRQELILNTTGKLSVAGQPAWCKHVLLKEVERKMNGMGTEWESTFRPRHSLPSTHSHTSLSTSPFWLFSVRQSVTDLLKVTGGKSISVFLVISLCLCWMHLRFTVFVRVYTVVCLHRLKPSSTTGEGSHTLD